MDEHGNVVDGDSMLFILSQRLKERGILNDNTVVVTVMSNSGLLESLKQKGIQCVQTKVGDRFVYECMKDHDYCLGGEQSGHIILKKYATTGDGLLTAIMIAEEVCDRKSTLSELVEDMKTYPQYMRNVRVLDKNTAMSDPAVLAECEAVEKEINGHGRVLLRPSGTEPVVRVMVEAETEELCRNYVERICQKVIEGGHCVE